MNSYVKQMLAVGCGVLVSTVLVDVLKHLHKECSCRVKCDNAEKARNTGNKKKWHESCCSEDTIRKVYRDGFSDGWQSGYDCAAYELTESEFDSDSWDDDDCPADWCDSADEGWGSSDTFVDSEPDDLFGKSSDLFKDTVEAMDVLNTASYDDKVANLFSEPTSTDELGKEGDMEDTLEDGDLQRLEGILGVNK